MWYSQTRSTIQLSRGTTWLYNAQSMLFIECFFCMFHPVYKKNSQESSCSHTWFQFCGGKKRREEIVFCSECCDGDLCNNKGCGSDGMWLFQPISPQPCLTDHYSIFKHVHTCLSESRSNPWTKQFWATTVKCLAQMEHLMEFELTPDRHLPITS